MPLSAVAAVMAVARKVRDACSYRSTDELSPQACDCQELQALLLHQLVRSY